MRIEPPPSVPSASAPMPDATAAAAPPLEPPGVSAGLQGFRVTPWSGPSGSPFVTAISASRAAARACSAATRQNALSVGFSVPMRARAASVASTGESFFARINSAISHAERHVSIDGRIVSFSVVETFDRRGALVADIAWTAGGALQIGWVRIPDGSWLAIEPRAAADARWGLSDRISQAAARGSADRTPVTLFETLDWARVDRI